MFLFVFYRNIKRAYAMYKFFEQSRKRTPQPLRVVKFYELYKAVKTR